MSKRLNLGSGVSLETSEDYLFLRVQLAGRLMLSRDELDAVQHGFLSGEIQEFLEAADLRKVSGGTNDPTLSTLRRD